MAGLVASAVDPDFEARTAEIRAANTQICCVCGRVHFKKERSACEGCTGLLEAGQTALVDAKNRFAFVEFKKGSANSDLRGKIESVDSRVIDTILAHAAKED